MTNSEDVEILVNIAAPCTASDDAHYRALASAYLEFQSNSTTHLGTRNLGPVTTEPKKQSGLGQGAGGSSQTDYITPQFPSFRTSEASFQSVWETNSPRIWVPGSIPEQQVSQTQTSQAPSWQPPPSVIADSNPNNDVHLTTYCSPTRLLEHYFQVVAGTPLQSVSPGPQSPHLRGPLAGSSQDGDVLVSETTRSITDRGEIAAMTPERSSQDGGCVLAVARAGSTMTSSDQAIIPSSVPTGPNETTPSSQTSQVFNKLLRTESPHRGSTAHRPSLKRRHQGASPRADSEPPPLKRHKRSSSAAATKPLARSSSDIGPQGASQEPSRLGTEDQTQILNCVEVHPPEPPIGIMELEHLQLVTEQLQEMARKLNLEKRFRPVSRKRELRPFERGHWLLDTSKWDQDTAKRAWGFLWNYISKGTAGWGVWCRRDEEWSWLRIYCWGSLVGHIYLLLYLASERKILFTGGSWIGGDGEELIVLGRRKS
jgi:hypothetical protein